MVVEQAEEFLLSSSYHHRHHLYLNNRTAACCIYPRPGELDSRLVVRLPLFIQVVALLPLVLVKSFPPKVFLSSVIPFADYL